MKQMRPPALAVELKFGLVAAIIICLLVFRIVEKVRMSIPEDRGRASRGSWGVSVIDVDLQ